MSPDPNSLKTSNGMIKESDDCENTENNFVEFQTSTTIICHTTSNMAEKETVGSLTNNNPIITHIKNGIDVLVKTSSLSLTRERRNVPSPSINIQNETFLEPPSPSSSSSTSQTTSANDATFEPTIEMMVNDFDDEQTLNEEEALAALESQDPAEEINTLKEESEMPLEELLAKYSALPPYPLPSTTSFSEPLRKKSKKLSTHKKKHKSKGKSEVQTLQTINDEIVGETDNNIGIESSTSMKNHKKNVDVANDLPDVKKLENYDEGGASCSTLSPLKFQISSLPLDEEKRDEGDNLHIRQNEVHKVCRSHLLDLYPEGTFDNVVVNDAIAGNSKDIPLETLYGVEDDDDEDEEIEEDEDYKKKVMIGSSYQATIPVGLSQYGDILPYENEDKLIWEPSQVSEREVEEYLLKIRDIKSNQQGEDDEDDENVNGNFTNCVENNTKENDRIEKNKDNMENNSLLANGNKTQVDIATAIEMDGNPAVVKDNEQALHLLVQCGYDFKEALRRKRLNALPLNDCMSLWSEEECHKFEEGIQKYGKDFLKIRQNQVRTRTMRELVQFYYLWKKSERRDHNFANADTVDHMDIYLNEDNEYGSNSASISTPVGSPTGYNSNCTTTRRNSNTSQKSISIMTTTTSLTNNVTPMASTTLQASEKCVTNTSMQQQQYNKRRTNTSCNNITVNDLNHESSFNPIKNFSK
ncbi:uncharacterized protein ACRADG_009701 isoform 2-T2 [Cochliomyia hominivorax]